MTLLTPLLLTLSLSAMAQQTFDPDTELPRANALENHVARERLSERPAAPHGALKQRERELAKAKAEMAVLGARISEVRTRVASTRMQLEALQSAEGEPAAESDAPDDGTPTDKAQTSGPEPEPTPVVAPAVAPGDAQPPDPQDPSVWEDISSTQEPEAEPTPAELEIALLDLQAQEQELRRQLGEARERATRAQGQVNELEFRLPEAGHGPGAVDLNRIRGRVAAAQPEASAARVGSRVIDLEPDAAQWNLYAKITPPDVDDMQDMLFHDLAALGLDPAQMEGLAGLALLGVQSPMFFEQVVEQLGELELQPELLMELSRGLGLEPVPGLSALGPEALGDSWQVAARKVSAAQAHGLILTWYSPDRGRHLSLLWHQTSGEPELELSTGKAMPW